MGQQGWSKLLCLVALQQKKREWCGQGSKGIGDGRLGKTSVWAAAKKMKLLQTCRTQTITLDHCAKGRRGARGLLSGEDHALQGNKNERGLGRRRRNENSGNYRWGEANLSR